MDTVALMIEELRRTTNLQRMEQLADNLAVEGEKLAIDPLLYRLGDIQVQADPDVEDAICGALVKFGVMQQLGNLIFRFEDRNKLDADVRNMLEKYSAFIPRKYFRE